MIAANNWAQAQEAKAIERMALVKLYAAYRVWRLSGNRAIQDSAALAALLALLNGGSAANAIYTGVACGRELMQLNPGLTLKPRATS